MIKIITMGKIKETYLQDAACDYLKRIGKYQKIEVVELKESVLGEANKDLKSEAINIKQYIKPRDYVIVCDIKGISLDTIALSEKINQGLTNYPGDIIIIIGSSHGLDQSIKDQAHLCLSFSQLTFPHQLFRIILLEQIYRVFKILNNESYHK